jgi:hypothetical protein
MRAAIVLATALLIGLPIGADAAVTKTTVLACKDESDLRQAVKLRTGGDRKASTEFEKGKIGTGSCLIITQNSVVGVDERKPPLLCVRPSGGFDCYWTILSAVDEFLTKPLAPKEPPPAKGQGK